jgi:hypothetical protein
MSIQCEYRLKQGAADMQKSGHFTSFIHIRLLAANASRWAAIKVRDRGKYGNESVYK